METLLVPVDFSENSVDATRYAVALSSQLGIAGIVLYHSNIFGDKPESDILTELEKLKKELNRESKVAITCVANSVPLSEGIADLIIRHRASIIVMGIRGRNKVGQKLIGSHVFQVSKSATVPVLIVPEQSVFSKIEHAALALPIIAELKKYIPYEAIKSLIKKLGATLMVLNISKIRDKTPKPIVYAGLADTLDMFDDMSPTYHFFSARNTADGIAHFAKDNHAQLLISVAGDYGFLQGMFRSSVTRKLAYQSTVPLLICRSGNETIEN
ncbi:universal stress protein [Olivibacter sitiensis]|uniref:universal stress protein n=1 Tax=Olivibacter sitiensis TaxID=376470 RepID=UPI0003F6E3BA|nr:universal stress protein [Olivibacter sitiensis]